MKELTGIFQMASAIAKGKVEAYMIEEGLSVKQSRWQKIRELDQKLQVIGMAFFSKSTMQPFDNLGTGLRALRVHPAAVL